MKKQALIPVQDEKLLEEALTHRSWLNEHPHAKASSNERLEFLGDAVLELAATRHLFTKYPDKPEGELTSLRASLVKTETLAKIAKELGLGERLRLSYGEEMTGGRENPTLLANTVEAVIGALYLEKGMRSVETFLKKRVFPELTSIIKNHLEKDSKSRLQELVQAKGDFAPVYKVENEEGPDHQKTFTVGVYIHGKRISEGLGKSKQVAQQEAATIALGKLLKNMIK